jgi:hypothetical protein
MASSYSQLHGIRCATSLIAVFFAVLLPASARAAQTDISGPPGSVAFGTIVAVLPNGNFVVTDPQFSNSPLTNVGAVYLYSPAGVLISTVTGSTTNDQVGDNGVVVVGSSNFLILSSQWINNGAANAGAVTWVNGTTGLSGYVSAGNSLVGTTTGDMVGSRMGFLTNGNYVVMSPNWNNGVPGSKFGAATWGDGNTGVAGTVSASNSLVGTTAGDNIGNGFRRLTNGNYVVVSSNWNNGVASSHVGAVTWINGSTGLSGAVSTSNSLYGTTAGDAIGSNFVTALSNGNYVVASSNWNDGVASAHFGAATWGNGTTGIVGPVSTSNSLFGTLSGDFVGSKRVVALSNGNYVVASPKWTNSLVATSLGAATWGDGSSGTVGAVSTSNSLYGTTANDAVAKNGVTALTNGNYVVNSQDWNNGVTNSKIGAATWGDGSSGSVGPASAANSLIGATNNDAVGYASYALSNGNYVVCSPQWNNSTAGSFFGAATWGDGSTGITGPVSTSNSLFGTTANDSVCFGVGVTPLSNGNYVVSSSLWAAGFGAATWGDGSGGVAGPVSASNSLVGTTAGDGVGTSGIIALTDGNYVVNSATWNNGVPGSSFGAATWANGKTGITGYVSAANSLIGTTINDQVGLSPFALGDGNYVVANNYWNGNVGAITLASDAFRLKGTVQSWNSVIGAAANGGLSLSYDYDYVHKELLVGRPADNMVSLFTIDQIFAGDFEP